ncbi:putative 1,3-beta-glucan synthase [Helianthus annuus]|nr:putative 1,3-beta-glucan synthase [Helianthus annuus]
MNLRQRPAPTRGRGDPHAPPPAARYEEPYNIIPIHSLLSDHPSLRYPEVRAAAAALRAVGDLRRPPYREWRDGMDLMDWLGAFFGFQNDNVRNQREHLVLHLANAQMRLSPPPAIADNLDPKVLHSFRRKLLRNYESWCSYLRKKSQVRLPLFRQNPETHRRELLYVAMYLLIWGEAGNLRFTPECICYIYHHMTMELNQVLSGDTDVNTARPFNPSIYGENAFLTKVVTPIYKTIKTEVERSRNGTAPHSAWRNYDDINEFFWSRKCFKKLKWPLDLSSNFFVDDPKATNRVGKTGFVEQRTFWNIFRNFDRLWVLLFLFFQAAMIVAWRETEYPWDAIRDRDVQVELLTVFITWAGLRFAQSILDAGTQYSLVSKDSKLLLFRMVMKSMVSLTWTAVFTVFYVQIWIQKNSDGRWSDAALDKIYVFLKSGFVFIVPEVLALILFILPWVRNFIENTDFILFDMLTWWFHSRLYVGRGLREGLVDNIKYTLFWIAILLSKFSFSYFLQIKPLVAPTKALLSLRLSRYNWHEFFSNTNRMALLALNQASELASAPDRWVWFRISTSEYRRCAVIEAYCSIRYVLLYIIHERSEERGIVTRFFEEIDKLVETGKFTTEYKCQALPNIHAKLIILVDILMSPKQDMRKLVDVLQTLYELMVKELPRCKKPVGQLMQQALAPRNPATTEEGLLFVNKVRFPKPDDAFFHRQLRRLKTILSSRDSMRNVPKNIEARRRIAFFSNSVFMNIPRAPQVEKMMAFSVLTPYYDEDVLYKKESLRNPNDDGISTLFYLQKIYEDEWENFMERMRGDGMENDDEIFTTRSRDLRVWASYRGQTLSRTVRGMMYYYRALKILAYLDTASEMEMQQGSMGLWGSRNLHQSRAVNEFGAVMMKFTYVVACQIYGTQKRKGESQAEDIANLMKNNEALRVAYVDEVHLGRGEVEYYSVLVKYNQQLKQEEEIYRIKLPGPMKLGEGKPENQNHAIIFTRGDALQTIDMNQDHSFEEALKMRNLLEEFKINHGIRKPTILGVRENIFTGSVSSLAWFMSTQEMSFVTLGQRVLANPLKVRMHYGHPDVFDRFWFLTRGGVSKASKVINISEDIFAGFNCTLRGGNVTHHEYIQVGKGRDVGLNQISMFEAKVSSGNGEQVLSRDVYRLGHRLDFFRMMSFFYTTVGFYYNTMIMILMVYTFLWGRLYLALSGVEGAALDNTRYNRAFGAVLNQQFVVQIGVFTALPMIVENSIEHGFLSAVWDYLTMQLQLASIFFTFSMGTRSHYFGRTILHGGAKYRATGRGFVVEHKSFAENYRLYARSHFVKGIELGVILIVYASNTPLAISRFIYIILNLSSWFLVVSWIMGPFVFNPSGFDWLKTVYDFNDFVKWLFYGGGSLAKADVSWETWWYEEQDHLRATGLWGKLLEIILDLRFFFFQYGVVYHLNIAEGKTGIGVYLISWVFMIAAVAVYIVMAYAQDKYAANEHIRYRKVQVVVTFAVVFVTLMLLNFTALTVLDLFSSVLAFIPTGWGIISIAQVLRPFLESSIVWDSVVSLARIYDLLIGMCVLAPLAFLSWMPGFQAMQTRILFNEAFSRGLQISRILTGKKINPEILSYQNDLYSLGFIKPLSSCRFLCRHSFVNRCHEDTGGRFVIISYCVAIEP